MLYQKVGLLLTFEISVHQAIKYHYNQEIDGGFYGSISGMHQHIVKLLHIVSKQD